MVSLYGRMQGLSHTKTTYPLYRWSGGYWSNLRLFLAGFDLLGTAVSDEEKDPCSSSHYEDDSTSMFSIIACLSWETKLAICVTYCLRQSCLNDTSITSRVVFVKRPVQKQRKWAEAVLHIQVCKRDSSLDTAEEETLETYLRQGRGRACIMRLKLSYRCHTFIMSNPSSLGNNNLSSYQSICKKKNMKKPTNFQSNIFRLFWSVQISKIFNLLS